MTHSLHDGSKTDRNPEAPHPLPLVAILLPLAATAFVACSDESPTVEDPDDVTKFTYMIVLETGEINYHENAFDGYAVRPAA